LIAALGRSLIEDVAEPKTSCDSPAMLGTPLALRHRGGLRRKHSEATMAKSGQQHTKADVGGQRPADEKKNGSSSSRQPGTGSNAAGQKKTAEKDSKKSSKQ